MQQRDTYDADAEATKRGKSLLPRRGQEQTGKMTD